MTIPRRPKATNKARKPAVKQEHTRNARKFFWVWLSQAENQKTMTWIGSGIVVVVSGFWIFYLHISDRLENAKESPSPTISVSNGSIGAGRDVSAAADSGGIAVVTTGSVTIGITLDQYEAGLKRSEQKVRAELIQASEMDKDTIALLEKQLADIQSKIRNPESALDDYKAKLVQAYKAFDDLKHEVLPEQIKDAQETLIKGETARAEKIFQEVLAHGTANAGEAAYQLGQLSYASSDYKTAEQYFQKAVDLQPGKPLYLNDAGLTACATGQYGKAEPLLQRALAIRERNLGPDHPDVAQSLNNLAVLYNTQGQYDKTYPLVQRALAIRERALGPDDPSVAQSLDGLASVYYLRGQYDKAEPLLQRALAIVEKARGPVHTDVAKILHNLAWLYFVQGQYDKAEPMLRRVLKIEEKALGPAHVDVAGSLGSLAGLYYAQGQYDKAEQLYRRALAIYEKAFGSDHPEVGTICNNLAALYDAQGHYDKAEPLLQRALAIYQKAFGPDHHGVAKIRESLATLYRKQGSDAKAATLEAHANSTASH